MGQYLYLSFLVCNVVSENLFHFIHWQSSNSTMQCDIQVSQSHVQVTDNSSQSWHSNSHGPGGTPPRTRSPTHGMGDIWTRNRASVFLQKSVLRIWVTSQRWSLNIRSHFREATSTTLSTRTWLRVGHAEEAFSLFVGIGWGCIGWGSRYDMPSRGINYNHASCHVLKTDLGGLLLVGGLGECERSLLPPNRPRELSPRLRWDLRYTEKLIILIMHRVK